MSIGALVQEKAASATTGSSFNLVLDAAPIQGHSIHLNFSTATAAGVDLSSITQTGVTWVKQTTGSPSTGVLQQWLGLVTGGSPSATMTLNLSGSIAGGNAVRAHASEWPNYLVKDTTGRNNGTSNTQTTGTITPTQGVSALLIDYMVASLVTSGPTNGWTALTSGNSSRPAAYLNIGTTSGSYSSGWGSSNAPAWDVVWTAYLEAPTVVTTQPASSTTSGVAMANVVAKITTDGTTADANYTGNVTATLNTPTGQSGSLGGTVTVAAVAGIATFTNLIPTADGPGYTLTITPTGRRAVTTTAFTAVGAVVAANQALVTALGGDTKLISVHDPRIYSNGALASFPDTIGPVGSRAAGLTFAQATSGNRPSVSSGRLAFTAASSHHMATGQDSRLSFNASTPLYLIVIASASSTGPVATIANDPTSATAYPYAAIQAAGSDWKADIAPTGSGDRTQPDSGVAYSGGATRVMLVGKASRYSVVGSALYNELWRYAVGGRQVQRFDSSNVATNVGGGLKAALGRLGSTYVDASIAWVGVYAGDLTATQYQALLSFASVQFSASMANTPLGSLGMTGSSLEVGFSGTSPKTTAVGSGTTSPAYVAANQVSGSRGSLVTQGFDVGDVHSYNYGTNGFDYVGINALFDTDLALLADGQRTGPFVVTSFEIGNTAQNQSYTSTQILTEISALTTKIHALGGKHYVHTCPDRGAFYTTGTINSVGIAARDTNIALRASPLTYCDGIIEYELDPSNAFVINRAGTKAYTDGTYYSGSTHFTDTGSALLGQIRKNYFDANDSVLWPGQATSTLPLPLGGSATATVDIAAQSAIALPLSGSATATVAVAATASSALPLGGTVTTTVSLTVSSSAALPLAGSATATATIALASSVALPLGGTLTAAVDVAATSAQPLPLGGTVTAELGTTSTASSACALPLSGAVTATVALGAVSAGQIPLGGSVTATLALTMTSVAGLPLSGTVTAIVTAPGALEVGAYQGTTLTYPALTGAVTTRPLYTGTVLTFPA